MIPVIIIFVNSHCLSRVCCNRYAVTITDVTVHSVPSNTLRDAGNKNLLVQSPRSIVCFANLIYAIRINSRGMSRDFGILMPKHLAG